MHTQCKQQKGFTLVELLIEITILVILGVVVVVLIDPAEILAQSRDTRRISDLADRYETGNNLKALPATAALL